MANEQKLPLSRTLPIFTQTKVTDEFTKRQRGIPGHVTSVNGALVTVAFEIAPPTTIPSATMPVVGPEYIRWPIQVGDKGVALPCSVYIGNVSGMGLNVPSSIDVLQANLSTLVWFPIGSKNWTASPNANALVLYGGIAAGGVIVQDKAGSAPDFSTVINSSGINLKSGTDTEIEVNGTGVGFFGAAPVAQPTTSEASSVFVAGSGTDVTETSTFDGYTLAQVVKALRNLGLLA